MGGLGLCFSQLTTGPHSAGGGGNVNTGQRPACRVLFKTTLRGRVASPGVKMSAEIKASSAECSLHLSPSFVWKISGE